MTLPRGPVFVAGLERTGTSLMYALLASHPAIAMTRRTNLWTHFYAQYGDLSIAANFERCLSTMLRYRRIIKLELDADRLRRDFAASRDKTYARLFELIELQHAHRMGRPRWGDKSLHTERWADRIMAAYPGARIIHMIRDPRDRYASSQTRWVRRGGIGAGTAEWLASARLAERNRDAYPDRYRIVRYEALVAEPERSVREICDFIGEPFVRAMLKMGDAGRFTETGGNSSYGTRFDGAITSSSVGRYRTVLSPTQIAFVQLVAGETMQRLQYELDPTPRSVGTRVRLALGAVPLESARLLAWRARESVRERRGRPVPAHRLVAAGPTG